MDRCKMLIIKKKKSKQIFQKRNIITPEAFDNFEYYKLKNNRKKS